MARKKVKRLGDIKPYTEEFFRKHYESRAKGFSITYEQFIEVESRKSHQFLINGREVFVRYLKDQRNNPRKQQYHTFSYKTLGRVSVIGRITEDSDSIFTPGTYSLYITDIKSGAEMIDSRHIDIFTVRGRFLENASLGNIVLVRGKLEKVIRSRKPIQQIVLGTDPDDLLVQINKSYAKCNS